MSGSVPWRRYLLLHFCMLYRLGQVWGYLKRSDAVIRRLDLIITAGQPVAEYERTGIPMFEPPATSIVQNCQQQKASLSKADLGGAPPSGLRWQCPSMLRIRYLFYSMWLKTFSSSCKGSIIIPFRLQTRSFSQNWRGLLWQAILFHFVCPKASTASL